MKNQKLFFIGTLLALGLSCASREAAAQFASTWTDAYYIPSSNMIYAETTTELDYESSLYYGAEVFGSLYGGGQSTHCEAGTVGALFSTVSCDMALPAQAGQTYTAFGNHNARYAFQYEDYSTPWMCYPCIYWQDYFDFWSFVPAGTYPGFWDFWGPGPNYLAATDKVHFATTETSTDSVTTPAPIPTRLKVSIGGKRTHNGNAIKDHNGNTWAPVAYGYSRLLIYTVLDQNGKAIRTSGMTVREVVTEVAKNVAVDGTGEITTNVNAEGMFGDLMAFFRESPPPFPPGSYLKQKQVITIQKGGATYNVGVVCVNKQHDDVTLTYHQTQNPSTIACD